MSKYIVSTMIQSGDNPAVVMPWYRGDDLAQAIAAMVSVAADHVDTDARVPAALRYRTLGVTLSIEPEPDESEHMLAEVRAMGDLPGSQVEGWCNSHEGRHTFTDGSDGDEPCVGWRTEADMVRATGSTVSFDTETYGFSLSNCFWYGRRRAQRPEWASGDCAGPRVGLVHGGEHDNHIMCEHHFNQMPRN